MGRGGYRLQVVREVRCAFSRCLKVSNTLDSMIAAGNSLQMLGVGKSERTSTEISSGERNT